MFKNPEKYLDMKERKKLRNDEIQKDEKTETHNVVVQSFVKRILRRKDAIEVSSAVESDAREGIGKGQLVGTTLQ